MKLATWNVNSVRARQERLLRWLEKHQPDILCLQELKGTEDNFPFDAIHEAGYHAAVYGQKTYNGVAILSRTEPSAVLKGFNDETEDPQARLISAMIHDVRVICAYFPNGAEVGSDKYTYKLDWMDRLVRFLNREASPSDPMILCGDFNVAPDDQDVARPEAWMDTVLCHPEVRESLERIRSYGFTDVFRMHHPEGGIYSWWDYRNLGFPKNNGLRIDHIFATEPLAKNCGSAVIDRDERKGKSPSDHAPVIATFE